MQLTIVQCYRSKLKTRGYKNIHITKVDDDVYFVECIFNDNPVCAVVKITDLFNGLAIVPQR